MIDERGIDKLMGKARSFSMYRLIGRFTQVLGLLIAVYGFVGALRLVWGDQSFSTIVGGLYVTLGLFLTIVAEGFIVLYSIDENARRIREMMEQSMPLPEQETARQAAASDEPEPEPDRHRNATVCPKCGCPVREGKSKCPACGYVQA